MKKKSMKKVARKKVNLDKKIGPDPLFTMGIVFVGVGVTQE